MPRESNRRRLLALNRHAHRSLEFCLQATGTAGDRGPDRLFRYRASDLRLRSVLSGEHRVRYRIFDTTAGNTLLGGPRHWAIIRQAANWLAERVPRVPLGLDLRCRRHQVRTHLIGSLRSILSDTECTGLSITFRCVNTPSTRAVHIRVHALCLRVSRRVERSAGLGQVIVVEHSLLIERDWEMLRAVQIASALRRRSLNTKSTDGIHSRSSDITVNSAQSISLQS